MSVFNRAYLEFAKCSQDRAIYNHLQNDFIQISAKFNNTYQYANNNNVRITHLGELLRCAAYAVPLLGALIPKAGIPLRLVTDLSEFAAIGKRQWRESLIKSAFSGVSAYCIFFAPLYSMHVEVVRSLVMHVRDIKIESTKYKDSPQPALHLVADLFNLLVLSTGGLELEFASHAFQVCAGLLDQNEALSKESYLGAATSSALIWLRCRSLIATGQALYQPKN